MSYILDALSKSEQEQRNREVPDLGTRHDAPRVKKTGRAWAWAVGLTILVAANGTLFYLYATRQPAEVTQASAPTLARAQSGSTGADLLPPSRAAAPALPTTGTSTLADGELIVPARRAQRTTSAPAPPLDFIDVSEVPLNILEQLPDMRFSSHIYASDPALRMVNINGSGQREGDTVAPGLQVARITEEGVVFYFRGYTFEMSVVADWAFE